MNLKEYVHNIQDYPKPGVLFRDLNPLISSTKAFNEVIVQLSNAFHDTKADV